MKEVIINSNVCGYLEDVNGDTTIEVDPSKILTEDNYATKIGAATTSASGLMSASDKSKLDGIASGATKVTMVRW